MNPKQTFKAYGPIDAGEQANFCLACGGVLSDRVEGGRSRRVCESCGYIRFHNPAPAVSVLVVDGDRFLLGRRTADAFEGGRWCLPSGYVEYDEDYLTAALREVHEETGLRVEVTGILSVTSNFLAPQVHTVVTVLLARPLDDELLPGDDIDVVRWFAATDALPEMAFEADRHIIERYFATKLAGAPVDPTLGKPAEA